MSAQPVAGRSGSLLTEQQIAYYRAYGYLLVPGLFAAEIDALSDAFDEVFAAPETPRLDARIVGHRFEPWQVIAYFVERHPTLLALTEDPRLVEIAEELLGAGARYENSEGNVFRCVTEWHYDSPTSLADHRHLKFGFYLEPLTANTGALRVLAASHHNPSLYRGALEPCLGFDGAIESRLGVPGEELPGWAIPTTPGDLLVWDYRLLHGAYGSTAARRQFALNFVGAAPDGEPVPIGAPDGSY